MAHFIITDIRQVLSFKLLIQMITKKTGPSLTGIRLKQYIEHILGILKSVAFHQLYMEKERQLLSQNQLYDSLTAFKSIDSFKHNKIVAQELKSFLQLHEAAKITGRECDEVLQCLNKQIIAVQYEDFEELTMTSNITRRNIALSRFNQMEVGIGTMVKVYDIKRTSADLISDFFMKQIKFYRQLLLRKQEFCREYSSDIYTFTQFLYKGKFTSINFEHLYQFSRQYKCYFNKQEFIALHKRTKSFRCPNPLFYDEISEISLDVSALSDLLLAPVSDLAVKQKMRIVDGVQFTNMPAPSYSYKNGSIRHREQDLKIEKQRQNDAKFVENQLNHENRDNRGIKFEFTYPSILYHGKHRNELKEMQRAWESNVMSMGNTQIDIRYAMASRKRYFV